METKLRVKTLKVKDVAETEKKIFLLKFSNQSNIVEFWAETKIRKMATPMTAAT